MFKFLKRIFPKRGPVLPTASIVSLHELNVYDGPLNVWESARGSAQCVRLDDGRLHVFEPGTFPSLLCGPGYILANTTLATILQKSCGHCVRFVPAAIINIQSGKQLAKYLEIMPHDEITPATLMSVDATGRHAWHFRRSDLFVTKLVMLDIQAAHIESLVFAPGFSDFLAMADTT